MRVFARHVEVLADARPDAPLLPLLQGGAGRRAPARARRPPLRRAAGVRPRAARRWRSWWTTHRPHRTAPGCRGRRSFSGHGEVCYGCARSSRPLPRGSRRARPPDAGAPAAAAARGRGPDDRRRDDLARPGRRSWPAWERRRRCCRAASRCCSTIAIACSRGAPSATWPRTSTSPRGLGARRRAAGAARRGRALHRQRFAAPGRAGARGGAGASRADRASSTSTATTCGARRCTTSTAARPTGRAARSAACSKPSTRARSGGSCTRWRPRIGSGVRDGPNRFRLPPLTARPAPRARRGAPRARAVGDAIGSPRSTSTRISAIRAWPPASRRRSRPRDSLPRRVRAVGRPARAGAPSTRISATIVAAERSARVGRGRGRAGAGPPDRRAAAGAARRSARAGAEPVAGARGGNRRRAPSTSQRTRPRRSAEAIARAHVRRRRRIARFRTSTRAFAVSGARLSCPWLRSQRRTPCNPTRRHRRPPWCWRPTTSAGGRGDPDGVEHSLARLLARLRAQTRPLASLDEVMVVHAGLAPAAQERLRDDGRPDARCAS